MSKRSSLLVVTLLGLLLLSWQTALAEEWEYQFSIPHLLWNSVAWNCPDSLGIVAITSDYTALSVTYRDDVRFPIAVSCSPKYLRRDTLPGWDYCRQVVYCRDSSLIICVETSLPDSVQPEPDWLLLLRVKFDYEAEIWRVLDSLRLGGRPPLTPDAYPGLLDRRGDTLRFVINDRVDSTRVIARLLFLIAIEPSLHIAGRYDLPSEGVRAGNQASGPSSLAWSSDTLRCAGVRLDRDPPEYWYNDSLALPTQFLDSSFMLSSESYLYSFPPTGPASPYLARYALPYLRSINERFYAAGYLFNAIHRSRILYRLTPLDSIRLASVDTLTPFGVGGQWAYHDGSIYSMGGGRHPLQMDLTAESLHVESWPTHFIYGWSAGDNSLLFIRSDSVLVRADLTVYPPRFEAYPELRNMYYREFGDLLVGGNYLLPTGAHQTISRREGTAFTIVYSDTFDCIGITLLALDSQRLIEGLIDSIGPEAYGYRTYSVDIRDPAAPVVVDSIPWYVAAASPSWAVWNNDGGLPQGYCPILPDGHFGAVSEIPGGNLSVECISASGRLLAWTYTTDSMGLFWYDLAAGLPVGDTLWDYMRDYRYFPVHWLRETLYTNTGPVLAFDSLGHWVQVDSLPGLALQVTDDYFVVSEGNAHHVLYRHPVSGVRPTTALPARAPDLVVYPNPASGRIVASVVGALPSGSTLELRDCLGNLLEVRSVGIGPTSFDLSDRVAGIYFLQLRGRGVAIGHRIAHVK